MSATTAMTTPHNVAILCQKLYDADSDIRYMSLNDLQTVFQSQNSSFLAHDYNQCAKIVDGFLHTLNDPNGEVQNMAIKCLGTFTSSGNIPADILRPMIHKIANLTTENTIDSSISAMAVRAVVVSLPRPTVASGARSKAVQDSYNAISQVLIPRLVGYIIIPHADKTRPLPPKGLLQEDLDKGSDSNSMDVLIEVARCFGPMLQRAEVAALQKISSQILESTKTGSVMKKKAITALSALSHHLVDTALSTFIHDIIEKLTSSTLHPFQHKLYLNLLGSLARAIPLQFSNHLRILTPIVLAVLSPEELDENMEDAFENIERDSQVDEVKEAALVAIDAFVSSCGEEMDRYINDSIDAALLYLKYDPNRAGGDEDELETDEENDGDAEEDEDFEEEGGADDEDDLSWKARRCAAKLLDTLVTVRRKSLLENAENYERIASALISRFKEREETVRLEVLATLAHMIRNSGEADTHINFNPVSSLDYNLPTNPPSRKRRRGASDASMLDVTKFRRMTGSTSPEAGSPPREGPPAALARVSTEMINSTLALLNNSTTMATKQALVGLLRDLVVVRHGGFDKNMDALLDPLMANINPSEHNSSTSGIQTGASSTSLRIASLQLLAEILKTHSSRSLQAYMHIIVPSVVEAMKTRHPKVSCEASVTAEQLAKALTPPRSASTNKKSQVQVTALLEASTTLINARGGDLDVRQSAIRILGILLGRCSSQSSGVQLLSTSQQLSSLELLWEMLKNETTRYASIKALDTVGLLTHDSENFTPDWFSRVCLELGAQLRKANRSLRGASLATLRTLLNDSRCPLLGGQSTKQLSMLLLPLFTSNDLQLLAPALNIYAALIRSHGTEVVGDEFNQQLCKLAVSSIATSVLDELSALARAIAEKGLAQSLMKMFLEDVGVAGNPMVTGKVIGNLLVFRSREIGVTIQDFLNELSSTKDLSRKQLALSVLGEVALRSGSSSTLSPDLFISYFSSPSDKVQLAAATALGRAATGPGNVQTYVSTVLSRIQRHSEEQYIVLHAIEEILKNENITGELAPYMQSLWDASVSSSQTEDNKTIGAECLSNLVLIDPKRFLPALHALLGQEASSTRGLGIAAFRDLFAGSDSSYDKDLRPIIVDVLTSMLRDPEIENRRSALNAFNAAARSKPELVFPNIRQLFPAVIEHTFEDPSLVREESVGPFKHKVDDGLQVRKGAYETLYSLTEIALTRIDIVQLYDRVIAGIGDEHDIRTLCNLMITKLLVSAPAETAKRLDSLADQFRSVVSIVLKDTAVKQEHEKTDESKRAVIKVSIELNSALASTDPAVISASGGRPNWASYWDWLRKEHGNLFKEVEKDVRKESERL